MDHLEIEARGVIERYLQGKLAGEEEPRFEEHLLDCAECWERIRWEDDFGRSLRVAAAHDVARATMAVGWWSRLVRSRQTAGWMLALLLGVMAVPSALYLHERDRVSELTAPQVNTPIFTLGAVRDAAPEAPVHRVRLGPALEWIVLSLELPRVDHAAYRAVLTSADGDVVWRAHGLEPDARDTLVLSLHSSSLEAGDHVLRVEGLVADGAAVPAGEFPFRVVHE